eukprot:CAMPEP_0172056798 /NCGR_PEP_ID=MMETSP1043-20130122/5996_1 /TAXON_ID=464988 /ORGANISM="Hemiselmis andersenii, Strain CCMP441" /LENGTH=77 /DNA_ID=CAMNT_0012716267 /DNA_START=460 /DNA_END=689 /DNA_ORIENTATION=-
MVTGACFSPCQPKGANELGTPVQISQAEWRHRAPMDGLGCGIEQAKHVEDILGVQAGRSGTVRNNVFAKTLFWVSAT